MQHVKEKIELKDIDVGELDIKIACDGDIKFEICSNSGTEDNYLKISKQIVLKQFDKEVARYKMENNQLIVKSNVIKEIDKELQTYNVFLEIRNENNETLEINTNKTLTVHKDFIFDLVNFEINNNELYFSLNIENSEDIEYAFYIYLNGSIYKKVMYSSNNNLILRLEDEYGEFKVKYFIRNFKTKEKWSFITKTLVRNEPDQMKINRLENELAKLKKELKKQKNNVESLQKIIIEQKKKEIDLGEKIISMLIKEKKLLNSHKKLVKKYEALRNSKLGKLTYAYWKFKKRIMMRG